MREPRAHRSGPACPCVDCHPPEEMHLKWWEALLLLIGMFGLVLLTVTGGHYVNRVLHG